MTLERAIKMVRDTYTNAKKLEYIRNPLAFALYKVWRIADGEGRSEK